MHDFSKSVEQSYRKYIRGVIRKTDRLTKTEKEITLYLVNLWFHHRTGPKPYIHPSNQQIVKKVKCVRATVQTCRKLLRDLLILREVGYACHKGKRATQYVIDIDNLIFHCDRENYKNWASAFTKIGPQTRPKIGPCISNVQTSANKTLNQGNIIYLNEAVS